jgi:hypothetical protein
MTNLKKDNEDITKKYENMQKEHLEMTNGNERLKRELNTQTRLVTQVEGQWRLECDKLNEKIQ